MLTKKPKTQTVNWFKKKSEVICHHSRGSGIMENGANIWGGLKSQAIVNFMQGINYTLRVKRSLMSKV